MKVKPTAATSLERANNNNNDSNGNNKPVQKPTTTTTTVTAQNRTAQQHLHFDHLQAGLSSDTITIALNSNSLANIEPTKIDTTFKLMRTPPHEMLMWQVVTGAFGSLLRYAQESINVFFCPV